MENREISVGGGKGGVKVAGHIPNRSQMNDSLSQKNLCLSFPKRLPGGCERIANIYNMGILECLDSAHTQPIHIVLHFNKCNNFPTIVCNTSYELLWTQSSSWIWSYRIMKSYIHHNGPTMTPIARALCNHTYLIIKNDNICTPHITLHA